MKPIRLRYFAFAFLFALSLGVCLQLAVSLLLAGKGYGKSGWWVCEACGRETYHIDGTYYPYHYFYINREVIVTRGGESCHKGPWVPKQDQETPPASMFGAMMVLSYACLIASLALFLITVLRFCHRKLSPWSNDTPVAAWASMVLFTSIFMVLPYGYWFTMHGGTRWLYGFPIPTMQLHGTYSSGIWDWREVSTAIDILFWMILLGISAMVSPRLDTKLKVGRSALLLGIILVLLVVYLSVFHQQLTHFGKLD
ncbi:MAG: hypothetical protein NTY53_14960 [Kiritimatiellaeota bacterium]|nr:hypothetical protein [Kiritimatiellota bacterium]